MSISKEMKQKIKTYILDKISEGAENVVKRAEEAFDISHQTAYRYLNELVKEELIVKEKRGVYLVNFHEDKYELLRDNGDLQYEDKIYNKYFQDKVKDLPANVQSIWSYAFSEMLNNVIDHSECSKTILLVRTSRVKTEIYICDNGVGIFEKIRTAFNYSSNEDALQELFKGKLTTNKEEHSGEGIFFSSRLMDEYWIFSDGLFFSHNKYNEEWMHEIEGETKGTIVYMALSNSSKKQTKDVFDEYADVDGGFTKTAVKIKNMFDSSPVSRSQAKRLCNRLDEFEEVVVDFEDVDWMGQGFAHQLFCVFAKNNPDIRITPINMSLDVEKMYNHVVE